MPKRRKNRWDQFEFDGSQVDDDSLLTVYVALDSANEEAWRGYPKVYLKVIQADLISSVRSKKMTPAVLYSRTMEDVPKGDAFMESAEAEVIMLSVINRLLAENVIQASRGTADEISASIGAFEIDEDELEALKAEDSELYDFIQEERRLQGENITDKESTILSEQAKMRMWLRGVAKETLPEGLADEIFDNEPKRKMQESVAFGLVIDHEMIQPVTTEQFIDLVSHVVAEQKDGVFHSPIGMIASQFMIIDFLNRRDRERNQENN